MRWPANFWGVFFFLATITIAAQADDPKPASTPLPKGPLSPEESLKHLVLADPNLVIEIVAAEPEVVDPVAIQFDEHGRLWVVEMRDYPNGPEPGQPPMSRIKLLEDKDGDGRYETAHVFADKLLFATGVQPWDGGVIVTLAGEVAYFKDTDGDHKADVRETWFTGFSESNPQLRANHPTFGPDGWIYVANGLRGGNVIGMKKDWPLVADASRVQAKDAGKGMRDASTTEPQPVSLTGRDFKFDPLTGRYEAISGNGQFGMTFDAWGNRFVCDNRHPCRHVIFEEDFIKRCPHVAFPAVVNDVIPADDKNKVFPLTSAWTTSNLHAGTFTASCGVTVYTGDWLPEEFRGNVFVCEPTGNLVQRAIVEPDGVTFKSRNPYERSRHAPRDEPNASPTSKNNSTSREASGDVTRSATATLGETGTQEFLASRDDWFRPVDLQNGPDGALYVVDMYRAVIEHPEWVPDELKKRPDTWLGNDKGRIYRIRPKGEHPKRESAVAAANLDANFNSANGWHRLAASRVVHQQVLREPLPEIEFERPEARFLALRSRQLQRLASQAILLGGMVDNDERIRAEAVRIAGNSWLRLSMEAELVRAQTRLSFLIRSDSLLVQFQAMQSITHADEDTDEAIADGLAGIGCFTSEDRWMRQAILAGASHVNASQLLSSFLDQFRRGGVYFPNGLDGPKSREWLDARADFITQLCEQIAFLASKRGDKAQTQVGDEVLAGLLETLSFYALNSNPDDYWFELIGHGLSGVSNGLARNGTSIPTKVNALTLKAQEGLNLILDWSAAILREPAKFQTDQALLATRLLRIGQFDKVGPTLRQFAETSTNRSFRHAAIESFASFHQPEVDAWLIERYRSETPAIRRAILAALFASKERQLRLLEAIEQGQIAASELDAVRVNQLTQSKDETLRERAKKILAATAPASRKEVLDAYQSALSLKGDPQRGKAVFVKNCSTCHRVDSVGVNVAPDISDTRTKKPEQLLMDILDPNKAIDANYFAYAVVTKEGKTESGVISSESSNSITLKQPEGKVLTLLRSDIEEIRNTGLSLMPVGVEKNIDQQALADLIFWLKNWRYLDGKVPATSIEPK